MNPRTKAIYLLLALVPVYGWLPTSRRYGHQRRTLVTRWVDTKDKTTQDAGQDANPCWEELYDDDCVMENAAAASFIAAKWIKSMPCGEGVQVRFWPQASFCRVCCFHCCLLTIELH